MNVFADTSAFLALLDRDERHHSTAARVWRQLVTEDATVISTNYVLVETMALVQRRFGMVIARAFQESVRPLLTIRWVDEVLHEAATAALFTANQRRLSLVDCVSFETCRRLAITAVFAFDRHFVEQGFNCLR